MVAASPTFTSGSGGGIIVSSATGIAVGQTVEGDFIASDTYVYGISGTIITLSKSISYVPVAGTSIRFRGISMNLNAAATAATNAYFDTTMYSPQEGLGGEQGTYGVYATTVGDTALNVDPSQDNPLGTGGTIGLYEGMYLGLNLGLGLYSGLSPDGMTWLGPISALTGTGIVIAGNGCPTIVGSATEYATCYSYMNTTKRTYAILTLNSVPEGTLYPNQLVYMSCVVGGEPCRVISVTGKGIGTKVLLQIPEQNWSYTYGDNPGTTITLSSGSWGAYNSFIDNDILAVNNTSIGFGGMDPLGYLPPGKPAPGQPIYGDGVASGTFITDTIASDYTFYFASTTGLSVDDTLDYMIDGAFQCVWIVTGIYSGYITAACYERFTTVDPPIGGILISTALINYTITNVIKCNLIKPEGNYSYFKLGNGNQDQYESVLQSTAKQLIRSNIQGSSTTSPPYYEIDLTASIVGVAWQNSFRGSLKFIAQVTAHTECWGGLISSAESTTLCASDSFNLFTSFNLYSSKRSPSSILTIGGTVAAETIIAQDTTSTTRFPVTKCSWQIDTGTSTLATAFKVGTWYIVTVLGTTNWAVLGSAGSVGDYFQCTAVGTGTGRAISDFKASLRFTARTQPVALAGAVINSASAAQATSANDNIYTTRYSYIVYCMQTDSLSGNTPNSW